MSAKDIETAYGWKDGDATCLARVKLDGSNLTQATTTTITRTVFLKALDSGAAREVVSAAALLVVASVVFDALQTDDRWDRDNTGYNFRDTVASTVFTLADRTYEVLYSFAGSGGQVFVVRFDIQTRQ